MEIVRPKAIVLKPKLN
jgi:nitrate/nitrite transporter NarK